jgi:hypothetical protein
MYAVIKQAKRPPPVGWPEPPLLQMGQLRLQPELQAADRLYALGCNLDAVGDGEVTVQFFDAMLPEVQAQG